MRHRPVTCVNGRFLPARKASVSVQDRGFRFGDGVFETIRIENGAPYQWNLHLARLMDGLRALRITPPDLDCAIFARRLLSKNKATGGFLRITVSRGAGSNGYFPLPDIASTWVMEWIAPSTLPSDVYTLYQSSITRPPVTSLPGNQKLAHGIGSTLALLEAKDNGADEALLLSVDGMLCETASGNLFWLVGDTLFTPSLATNCVAGTTRAAILRLSPLPVKEVCAPVTALAAATACFISNVRLGVWPFEQLLPSGQRFDAAHPLIDELAQLLAKDRASHSGWDA